MQHAARGWHQWHVVGIWEAIGGVAIGVQGCRREAVEAVRAAVLLVCGGRLRGLSLSIECRGGLQIGGGAGETVRLAREVLLGLEAVEQGLVGYGGGDIVDGGRRHGRPGGEVVEVVGGGVVGKWEGRGIRRRGERVRVREEAVQLLGLNVAQQRGPCAFEVVRGASKEVCREGIWVAELAEAERGTGGQAQAYSRRAGLSRPSQVGGRCGKGSREASASRSQHVQVSSATVSAWRRAGTGTGRGRGRGWVEEGRRGAVRNAGECRVGVGDLLWTCNRRSNGPASTARTAEVVLVERAWSERRHMSAGEPLARASRSVVRLLGCVTAEPVPFTRPTTHSTASTAPSSAAHASALTAPALHHCHRRLVPRSRRRASAIASACPLPRR